MSELVELVRFLAESLTDNTDSVNLEEQIEGNTSRIRLTMPQSELGKVIGRQGRIARAIRVVLNAAASKKGQRAYLEIEG